MSKAFSQEEALAALTTHLTLRTAGALSQTVSELISEGIFSPGTQLPTVRSVAENLGMSRSAVGQAWKLLADRGVIETRRRAGTHVLGRHNPPFAKRYESMVRSTIGSSLDLGNLRSDTLPYPDLQPALAASLQVEDLQNPFATPAIDPLAEAVRQTWPFKTEHFLATHGLVDGLELALSSVVNPGDFVIVESPTHGRIYDILESKGANVISVPYGEHGPEIDRLRKAMISKPVAFVYQPQSSAPSGRSITAAWIEAAAPVLEGTMPIIELSQTALMHEAQVSLGLHLPDQVAQVRSYNFFFGAEMRQAIAGGNPNLLNAMWMKLTYSSRFVSRLLQGTLAHLLSAPESIRQTNILIDEAKRRHLAFTSTLTQRGFALEASTGPSIWLPVPDEHTVCTRLNYEGIAVHPGRFFLEAGSREQRIHLNSAYLSEGFDDIAHKIAEACDVRFPSY